MTESMVKVWDLFIRVFHWSMVLIFTIAYITGEEETSLHIDSGYLVIALVLLRIIWGFVGSKHARFSDFVGRPQHAIAYFKSLLSGHAQHYLGHNPAAAYMILILLFMLLAASFSGLKLYGIQGDGPLAADVNLSIVSSALADDEREQKERHKKSSQEELWEELHELTANITLFLVLIHITAVFLSGRLHKENLVKAMITGKKRIREDNQPDN